MLSIFYQKNENCHLFKTLEDNDISTPQNYIPIYKKFFSFTDHNYNKFNLNHMYHIKDIKALEEANRFECVVEAGEHQKKKKTFFKFSPLLDPTKYCLKIFTRNYHVGI